MCSPPHNAIRAPADPGYHDLPTPSIAAPARPREALPPPMSGPGIRSTRSCCDQSNGRYPDWRTVWRERAHEGMVEPKHNGLRNLRLIFAAGAKGITPPLRARFAARDSRPMSS